MVRRKNIPDKTHQPVLSVHDKVGDLTVQPAVQYQNMVVTKCHACQIAVNREGEKRPGIRCKDCKDEYCNTCAGLTVEQCDMMRSMARGFWSCKECESKSADMKAMLESMKSIKNELGTIKEGQADVVEAVTKRMERIEDVQEKQDLQLSTHEVAIKKNTKKAEEGDRRIKKLEDQVGKISRDMSDEVARMRQTNAVVKEIREIEKCEKNLIFCNIPESSSEDSEERKKEDENRLSVVFKELKMDTVKPTNVIRVGKNVHYPRKLKVVFRSQEDCDKILESGQKVRLSTGVFITPDRTYNQRQEARLYREEKEKEEASMAVGAGLAAGTNWAAGTSAAAEAGVATSRRPRGRPPGSGVGSVRGRKSRAPKRKGSGSGDRESTSQIETESQSQNKRQDVRGQKSAPNDPSRTPEPAMLQQVSDRQSTPLPRRSNSVAMTPAGTSSESF